MKLYASELSCCSSFAASSQPHAARASCKCWVCISNQLVKYNHMMKSYDIRRDEPSSSQHIHPKTYQCRQSPLWLILERSAQHWFEIVHAGKHGKEECIQIASNVASVDGAKH